MSQFEDLLNAQRGAIERFVRYRLQEKADADDCLQEIYLTAYCKFGQLKQQESFRAWLISIARNKCNDYFRRKASLLEIPVEELAETLLTDSRFGPAEVEIVRDTFDLLGDKDKQILYLYFWKELPQAQIAQILSIPLGTVKSRLHTAKQNFKDKYPCQEYCSEKSLPKNQNSKGEPNMKKLPEFLPEYEIRELNETPFPVKWEELQGWFLVPKPGECLSFGMYDIPSRACSHIYDMQVTGKAAVHGIEGMEITVREAAYSLKKDVTERTFVAQLTDTHCRYLAALRTEGDVRNYITFLDGDAFASVWGFGEDNCGNETNLTPKGSITRNGNVITSLEKDFLVDITGRYEITINGKSYDTVCVMIIESRQCDTVSEQFIDRSGRTILWRRFNKDDWAMDRYKKPWSQLLPENARLTINGETYVHWYDCITSYIL